MKYGCCLNMVAGGPDGTGMEHIAALAAAGYDYVELPLAEIMALDETQFTALYQALQNANIPCEACNNFFPKTLRLTGTQADSIEQTMEYVERALARAATLGARKVVFGSGGAKNVPAGFPIEEGWRQVTELTRRIGPVARQNGILIVIEPLRKAECNLINSFAEGCRLADDVDDSNVKVLVDYYHLTEEKESVKHVEQLGPHYLGHIHFANPKGRVYPSAQDGWDYSDFVKAIKAAGYSDTLSCEAYTSEYPRAAREALEFFKANFD
ncbi:sugar phosphate isomerase/epimerase [Anaerofilum sp. BX8]|uniref:Sugar phosphate isomerase/epimerase n=1 Tax=Anaerofilum hominis TaxID=2763016 RepID=A0A923I7T1_9FIRM|nr:sugar phosphate isomerase/epimerase family protein [Anaerofilum hominis]MBC5581866.1 sugar phosphate isomerase/epimerase [Anaerofilum hominis]